jgi:hypothetical protein
VKPADLDRLLRAAAPADEDAPEMPYGFDTRVVALWRAQGNREPNGIVQLVRRVAVLASIILIGSAAGAYREIVRSDLSSEPLSNEYAIADSAIANEVSR